MTITMDQAREGEKEIGEMLDSKQLSANAEKSKFLVRGPRGLRTDYLKDAESDPIIMGAYKLQYFC